MEFTKSMQIPSITMFLDFEKASVQFSSVQFSSVYCFAITKCTNANYYYYLNTNGEEAQGKPPG